MTAMHLPFLQQLHAHMEWADALVWQKVLAEDATQDDDYVLDSLVHLHVVQRAYLAVWQGEDPTPVTRDDFAGPVEIKEWARTYYPEMTEFLGQLSEERLGEIIPIPWTRFIEEAIGGPASWPSEPKAPSTTIGGPISKEPTGPNPW